MADRIPTGNDCGERRMTGGDACGCILAPGHPGLLHVCSCGRRWDTIGVCRCGHVDGEHFDEVKACARCECAAFRQATP